MLAEHIILQVAEGVEIVYVLVTERKEEADMAEAVPVEHIIIHHRHIQVVDLQAM
jgi:hypothetical protein